MSTGRTQPRTLTPTDDIAAGHNPHGRSIRDAEATRITGAGTPLLAAHAPRPGGVRPGRRRGALPSPARTVLVGASPAASRCLTGVCAEAEAVYVYVCPARKRASVRRFSLRVCCG